MGRLNKALERIKSREAAIRSASGSYGRPALSVPEIDQPGFADPFVGDFAITRLDRDHLNNKRVLTEDTDPGVRTAYKMLRTRVLQNLRANGWRSLAVTSAAQGDGKTVTAINLAISMAGDVNHQVCLVDLDMRHSSVSHYLGLTPKTGVSQCLQDKAELSDIILKTDVDRLFVVPNTTQEEHTSELLSSPKMKSTCSQLTANPNRTVIFDMPPVLAADDMLAFAPMVDAILLVVAEGKTARTDAMKANELLMDLNVIGTLLNRSDEKTVAYY